MFIKVFIIGVIVALSPGPDFVIVMRNSLLYGARAGCATALGIGSAIIIHITYTLIGFAFIIQKNPKLFQIIQFAGAAYLLWLAYNSFVSKEFVMDDNYSKKNKQPFSKSFRTGFINNCLNPKATLFFLSIFSQFLSPTTPYLVQFLYGLEILGAVCGWSVIMSFLVSSVVFRKLYSKRSILINRTFGCVLCYFGLRIIWNIASINYFNS